MREVEGVVPLGSVFLQAVEELDAARCRLLGSPWRRVGASKAVRGRKGGSGAGAHAIRGMTWAAREACGVRGCAMRSDVVAVAARVMRRSEG